MTKNNIDIVKIFFDAAPKGDMEAARGVLDDNLEWIEPEVPGLWFSGTHRGADAALLEVVKPTFEQIDDFSVVADEYLDAGEDVIVLGRYLGRSKRTGKSFEIPACYVSTVRNGKIVRFRCYHNTAAWLDVAGERTEKKAA